MNVPEQWLLIFYVANQVASALVQALPAPNGNQWYNFFYKFLSLLVADFKSYAAQMPQLPPMTTTSKGAVVTTAVPAPSATQNSGVL